MSQRRRGLELENMQKSSLAVADLLSRACVRKMVDQWLNVAAVRRSEVEQGARKS